jgi:hypothetical protein
MGDIKRTIRRLGTVAAFSLVRGACTAAGSAIVAVIALQLAGRR